MSISQFKSILQKELHKNGYAMLSQFKKKLHTQVTIGALIRQVLAYRRQNTQYQILCFVTYEENNIVHHKYQVDYEVQSIFQKRKRQNRSIDDIFVQFLCIFKRQLFHFNNIVQIMIDSTKQMYQAALENQIQRNLTVIPPNAIMKNGKRYSQINPSSKTPLSHTASKTSIDKKKQPLQKTKSQTSELPRMNQSKAQIKKQQPIKNNIEKQTKKQQKQKKPIPNKKLRIQSDSESEDYYVPQKFIQTFDKKPIQKNQPMQIQNQGNYKENQIPQKMEIQKNQKLNTKDNSPKNTNADDSQDSMDMFMQQMNKKDANKQKSSIAKSLPVVKQTKLEFNKMQPTKTVASKQGSLFGWMGKKV